MHTFGERIEARYRIHPGETWAEIAERTVNNVMSANVKKFKGDSKLRSDLIRAITDKKFIPAGRYLYGSGRRVHNVNNCLALRVEDSREGWASLVSNAMLGLSLGAGVGINFSSIRPKGSLISGSGGTASGVMCLINLIDAMGLVVKQGGIRRGAILASLSWKHPEILDFVNSKKDQNKLNCMNISVNLDDDFFTKYKHGRFNQAEFKMVETLFENMYENGEPGILTHTGINATEDLCNPCAELRAKEDSTLCSLGSINLERVETLYEMRYLVEIASKFLILGGIYSTKPYQKCEEVLDKDRRIGLGLMGIAAFLYKNGQRYNSSDLLEEYLEVYSSNLNVCEDFTEELGISPVKKARAIAPNGTVSILAETTSGIEPPFARVYERKYYNNVELVSSVVEDWTCKKLEEKGYKIETTYNIALESKLRLLTQVQRHVDMAISSTLNFKKEDYSLTSFKNTIMKYLPGLRGVTAYGYDSRADAPIRILEDDCRNGFCST